MTQPQSVVDLADDDDNNADAVTAELQGYFSRSRTWECEKTLGHGAYGTAILVKERSGRDGRQRRVVLKRALGDGIAELKAEIATLEVSGSLKFLPLRRADNARVYIEASGWCALHNAARVVR